VASSNSLPIYYDNGDYRRAYVNITAGSIPVHLLIDTGATDLVVNQATANDLVKTGDAEWMPDQSNVTLADGKTIKASLLRIRSLTIGTATLRDIVANVNPGESDMLLGLSILNKVGRFTIDQQARQLTFG
jgi:clan AA aspartic protease (TIGR02281 family)